VIYFISYGGSKMQEIAMSILDIAYNSIRANASLIKILIHDSNNLNIINIRIIDNGKGMEQATIKKVVDPFYTTRTTRKVGLGIPMFKENIEATGGKFSIESTINVGTKVEGEFVKGHIDCPPMGNIVDTIITLIQADDKIDYLFKLVTAHEKNNLLDAHIIVLKIIKILAEKLIVDGFYIKEKHDDESYELVISIIKYINQHYQQKITLDKLALITNYNKSYLSNIFKKKTGITIFEYLRNVRLEHCLSDLKYKNNTIVEIALNNGFANIQIFNRIFKEIYKITPKQYRKK